MFLINGELDLIQNNYNIRITLVSQKIPLFMKNIMILLHIYRFAL